MIVTLALASVASLAWGTSDFLGGLKARSVPIVPVLAISQLTGLLAIGIVLAVRGDPLPHDARLLLGVLAGIIAVAELGVLYVAIARGPVIVVAPVAAVGAAIPVVIGIAQGDKASALTLAGIAAALVGALLAAWAPDSADEPDRPRSPDLPVSPDRPLPADPPVAPDGRELARDRERELASGREPARAAPRSRIGSTALLAAGAAVGIGAVYTLLDHASKADPVWATGGLRVGMAIGALGLLLVPRQRALTFAPRPRAAFLALGAIGLADVTADVSFATASTHGALGPVAVLSSLYPVVTVVLAGIFLRERMRPLQAGGAALALTGIVLLGAGG